MSHISVYDAQIQVNPVKAGHKDVTWDLLEEAVKTTAEEHGGQVTDEITDVFGRRSKVDFALRVPEFSNGLGIKVDRETGRVKFLYDDYGYNEKVIRGLRREVVQNYMALAVSQALDALNYEVDLEEELDMEERRRSVRVKGVM